MTGCLSGWRGLFSLSYKHTHTHTHTHTRQKTLENVQCPEEISVVANEVKYCYGAGGTERA